MKWNSLSTVGMCGGSLWNVFINDGKKRGDVLHKHIATIPRVRTEGEMERGGTEVIEQGDNHKTEMKGDRLRDLRVKIALRVKEAQARNA